MLWPQAAGGTNSQRPAMRVVVIFDKNTDKKSLHTGWGISFLINNNILFDTGENGAWLLKNAKCLQLDINSLEAAVISHDHWDHTGGLWEVLAERKGLKVYACAGFSPEFKERVRVAQGALIEVDKVTEISKGIFASAEIAGTYHGQYMPEQALFIRTEKGLSVITGCAHPGIVKILEKAKESFGDSRVYSAFGGFHLMESDKRAIEIVAGRFKELNVTKAGPTHCSGRAAEDIFKKKYGDDFIALKAGEDFNI